MSSKDTKSLICNSTQRARKGAASNSSRGAKKNTILYSISAYFQYYIQYHIQFQPIFRRNSILYSIFLPKNNMHIHIQHVGKGRRFEAYNAGGRYRDALRNLYAGGGVRDASRNLYGEKCTVSIGAAQVGDADWYGTSVQYNMTVKLGRIKGGSDWGLGTQLLLLILKDFLKQGATQGVRTDFLASEGWVPSF